MWVTMAAVTGFGGEDRGFDITGHRYWFDNPWANSDALLVLRTDLDAESRGLMQGEESSVLWWMPQDYPRRLAEILAELAPDRLAEPQEP